jgi:D-aspartate ligase
MTATSAMRPRRPEAEGPPSFLPVLLGSDLNAYGMARSFHEAYGVRSVALATFPLAPTRYSRIVDVEVVPDLARDDAFVPILLERARTLAQRADRLLLVPCGDRYAELVSRFQDRLQDAFVVAAPDHDLLLRLTNKASFYALCSTHGIDHPRTKVITAEDARRPEALEAPFGLPAVLKASDSVAYLDARFPGRKKAFVIGSVDELRRVVAAIYGAGYRDTLVVQEYIPGPDSQMRVLNTYSDGAARVRMMCLGVPLLEDHAPEHVGNYTAIRSSSDPELYARVQAFLEAIGYVGFANFDMKVDPRDGSYKLFELNPRQGRSSFFVTLAGYNLARFLVEDRVLGRTAATVYGSNEALWLQVPRRVFDRYVESADERARGRALMAAGRVGGTLGYRADDGFRRRALRVLMGLRYGRSYREQARARGGASATGGGR